MISPTTQSTATHPVPLVQFGPELSELMSLDAMTETARQAFLQNISELIIEGALLRYFGTIDEQNQSVFETWIQMHKHKENFVEMVRRTHPAFIAVLEEEIIRFKQEAFRIGVGERVAQ